MGGWIDSTSNIVDPFGGGGVVAVVMAVEHTFGSTMRLAFVGR